MTKNSEKKKPDLGQDIDYFQILKDRLDMYVKAMARTPKATDPASVIGPVFAETCGNAADLFMVMTGANMFMNIFRPIKEYIVKLI